MSSGKEPPKKDLTGLMDYAKALEASGQGVPAPEGSVMEEQKIDKIDDFESLDDYGKSNPAPEPQSIDLSPPTSETPSIGGAGLSIDFGAPLADPLAAPPSLETHDDPGFPPADASADASPDALASPTELESPSKLTDLPDFTPAPSPEEPLPDPTAPVTSDPAYPPGFEPAAEPRFQQTPQELSPPSEPASPSAEPDAFSHPPIPPQVHVPAASSADPAPSFEESAPDPTLRPAQKVPSFNTAPLEKVRKYSEQLSPARSSVPAAYPFSLMISGQLAPEEKARLVDLISRENMGIREIDLEPQFESGKILIPRISEYAAVLIISALRSARVKMRMGPSDSIYASADTQDSDEESLDLGEHQATVDGALSASGAEDLPITTETRLPGPVRHAVVDVVTASAALKTLAVEAEHSPEYQMLVESLQRELKYKAFRKGATAIVGFSVQLTQLHMPMHYRVMVSGSAVKPK